MKRFPKLSFWFHKGPQTSQNPSRISPSLNKLFGGVSSQKQRRFDNEIRAHIFFGLVLRFLVPAVTSIRSVHVMGEAISHFPHCIASVSLNNFSINWSLFEKSRLSFLAVKTNVASLLSVCSRRHVVISLIVACASFHRERQSARTNVTHLWVRDPDTCRASSKYC